MLDHCACSGVVYWLQKAARYRSTEPLPGEHATASPGSNRPGEATPSENLASSLASCLSVLCLSRKVCVENALNYLFSQRSKKVEMGHEHALKREMAQAVHRRMVLSC